MALTSLQEHAAAARVEAEQLLAARLATTAGLDEDRRCAEPTGNLVTTITEIQWQTIAGQLGGGNGGELQATNNHRPKFCSAFSSCALAVNAFGLIAVLDAKDVADAEAGRLPLIRIRKPGLRPGCS